MNVYGEMTMRVFLISAVSVLAHCAGAATVDVPKLPGPVFSDKEVSGDASLPSNRTDRPLVFRLEMTFDSTPSNNIQVAFGRDDMPADGRLAAE